ncbi:MAG: UDP-N-acetylmuramate--L-alanine ligase [Defluviitaleaceae bacterium]|nr:UDP-N-acetylmuramate--L-alanine ligase [Defluviitaleaceae bacterium]
MRKYAGLGAINRVHFIGIGGVSMSGLAEILFKDGFKVTGSDRTASAATRHLQDVGINIKIGCDEKDITPDIELVVYNAAIKPENPERAAAAKMGIPTMVRAELLGVILQGFDYPVCIAGSHGKTSTTALVTAIAKEGGLDPTVNIGGYVETEGKNNYIGESPYFVLEACEYSNSFHHWHPHIGVILNVDADHMDFYGSMDAIIDSFAKFASNIKPGAALIIQEGAKGFDKIVAGLDCEIITFRTDQENQEVPAPKKGILRQYWVRDVAHGADGTTSFDVMLNAVFQARVTFPLPGEYNMYNALAAFAAGQELGIEAPIIAKALSRAKGVKRRYEYKGEYNGITIIDDYAHHPTEIKACLAAARKTEPKRIICLFQPHTYTRTRNHFEDFSHAFAGADMTMFLPIYAAREQHDPTISSAMLADAVAENGHVAINCNSFEEAEEMLRGKLMPGDLLITMGAGESYIVGEALLAR